MSVALQSSFRSERTDVEITLLRHAGVADCAVLPCGEGEPESLPYVAYVVLQRALDPSALLASLTSLPSVPAVEAVVPVSTLPRRPDGSLDVAALALLAPATDREAARIEAALRAHPGVAQAAVFVAERTPREARLHLSELLPAAALAHVDPRQDELVPAFVAPARALPAALLEGAPLCVAPDAPRTLPESLEHAARAFDTARIRHLHADGGEQTQSFAALLDEAQRMLGGLRMARLGPGDIVVLQLIESSDVLPAFWACLLGGLIPVIGPMPASYLAATAERERVCHAFEALGAPVIVTGVQQRAQLLDSELSDRLGLDPTRVLSVEVLRDAAVAGERHPSAPDDVAFMVLSSGSTGRPKCIQLTHRNILARARGTNALCRHSPRDVILNWLPFDHIGSISDWHLRCVELGCDMLYCATARIIGDPLEWLRLIARYRITHSWAPNFAYARINAAVQQADERWDLSSMRSLLTAGEAVSSGTVEEFITRLAPHGLRRTAVRPAFGMAEVGSGVSYAQPTEARPVCTLTVDRASLTSSLVDVDSAHPRAISFASLGPVIPAMALRIVDEGGRVLPERGIGRLQLRGEALSPGYYQNDEANRVFLADGWFDTGDEGFVAEAELYLTGRSKDCIIVNGANYFPAEIEKVVEEVAGVEVSFTAAYTVRPAGSTDECFALFFSPADALPGTLPALLKAVQEQVVRKIGLKPDFIVPLEKTEIPKTGIGKIQRKQLAARFEAGEFAALVRQVDLWLANERTLPHWFSRPVFRPSALRRALKPTLCPKLLFLGEARALSGFGRTLSARWAEASHVLVEPGHVFERLGADHYRMNMSSVAQLGRLLDVVMHGSATELEIVDARDLVRSPLELGPSLFDGAMRTGVECFASLLSALAARFEPPARVRLLTLGSHAHAIGADDKLCPASALAPVLVRLAALGHPWLSALHLDLPPLEDEHALAFYAEQVADELAAPVGDQEVAYRDRARLVRALEPLAFARSEAQSPIRPGDLVLITGGLGGIGSALAQRLLSRHGAQLLLIGRTPIDGDATSPAEKRTRARFSALRGLGQVTYASLDVGDYAALEQAVVAAEQRAGAPLAGAFHLAGAYQERTLHEAHWPSLRAGMAAKVLGALQLHRLLSQRPRAFVVHASSAASCFPHPRAAGYALANRFLDALSQHERSLGRASYALGFSAWDGVGMNEEGLSAEALRTRGLWPLNLRRGLDSLCALLAQPPGHALVGVRDDGPPLGHLFPHPVQPSLELRAYYTARDAGVHARLVSLPEVRGLAVLEQLEGVPTTEDGALDREALRRKVLGDAATVQPPETATEALLSRIWERVLGQPGLGVAEDFFRLGGHSLLAAELIHQINAACHTSFPLGMVFEAPTIRQQARLLDDGQHGTGASVIPLQTQAGGRPLFCLCGINVYHALAQRLADACPVYGVFLPVEERVLNGAGVELSVREMAGQYVSSIREKQPDGPYRLLGLSFGAVLAYEAAQQLRAAGAQVELVVLLDFVLRQGRRRSLRRHLSARLASFRRQGARELVDDARRLRARLLQRVASIARPAAKAEGADSAVSRDVLRMEAYRQAWNKYESALAPYAGRAVVVRALDQSSWPGFLVAPDCGWSAFVRGGLRHYDVPGNHLTILQDPNVTALATILHRHLASSAPAADPCARNMDEGAAVSRAQGESLTGVAEAAGHPMLGPSAASGPA